MPKKKQKNEKKVNIKINPFDIPILIVVILLVGFGLVMVLSASAPSALAEYNNSYKYFFTQLYTSALGIVFMIIISFFDYRILVKGNLYRWIYLFGILMILSVLVPSLGVEVNGAKRWIDFGIQMQPSEITKICVIIGLAGYYSDNRIDFKLKRFSIWLPLGLVIIPVFLLYKIQNHMSAGILIGMTGFAIIALSGVKFSDLIKNLGPVAALCVVGYPLLKDKIFGDFRGDRLQAWRDPWADSTASGYQTIQSLYAIGSGGLFGVGLGKSKQKYLYIPEAHNDFIFAIIAEELGFVGCLAVILLFGILVIRGIYISVYAREKSGSLIGIGIITMIIVQVILNIAVVTNTIPNTGISLPFLSYGGSSIIILLASMGLLLSISRTNKKYDSVVD